MPEFADRIFPRRGLEPTGARVRAVPRGLRDFSRVEPVEERLLADLELVGHLEGGQVLHEGSIAVSIGPSPDPFRRGRIRAGGSSPGNGRGRGHVIPVGDAPRP